MDNLFEKEMLEKIVNGERLTEREIRTLVYKGEEVDEIEGDDLRWTRCMKTIIEAFLFFAYNIVSINTLPLVFISYYP